MNANHSKRPFSDGNVVRNSTNWRRDKSKTTQKKKKGNENKTGRCGEADTKRE